MDKQSASFNGMVVQLPLMPEGVEQLTVDASLREAGKPTIKGTRITAEQILRKLGAGMTCQEILEDHPHLTADDIRAVQAFAADYLADEAVILAEP